MMQEKLYTQNDLDIELLKQKNEDIYINFVHVDKKFDNVYRVLDKIESHQKWIMGVMGSGFAALFGLMAHGFKWL